MSLSQSPQNIKPIHFSFQANPAFMAGFVFVQATQLNSSNETYFACPDFEISNFLVCDRVL